MRVLRFRALTKSGYRFDSSSLVSELDVKLVVNDAPAAAVPYLIRPINPDHIDFALVRRWLALYELYYGKACRESKALRELGWSHPTLKITDFRCINTE